MWTITRLVIFVVATTGIVYLSRKSLIRPRSHGFFRFFVFEGTLALILLVAPFWIAEPLSWHQIISWILLVSSLFPLILGVQALRSHGAHKSASRAESELLAFERTSRLVREGIFHYIRHPMYSSLLLLAWGLFFKAPSTAGAAIVLLTTAGVLLMVKTEESECLRTFGPQYRSYMATTKRLLPYVF